jgi:hypothetical protein
LQAHFTLLSQQLIQTIAQATRSIYVAVCWFTLPELLEALMAAQQRGVQVAFIINFDQLNFGLNTLPFGKLLALGAKGFGYAGHGLLHHKFIIIDAITVVTGSYNWTRSQHHDSLVELKDRAIVAAFLQEWTRTQQLSAALETLDAKDARPISIAHLFQPSFWNYTDLRRNLLRGGNIWLVNPSVFFKEKQKFATNTTTSPWKNDFQRQLWALPQCNSICEKAVASTGGWERNTLLQYAENYFDQHALPLRGNAYLQAKLFSKKLNEGDLIFALHQNTLLALGVAMSAPLFDAQQGGLYCAVEWQVFPTPKSISFSKLPKTGFKRLSDGGLALLEEVMRR